ncbi:MAG TPA: type II and III secretion system protein family protein [Xanthobacteraceae bacterium]|nr:type II and III secretion system protein family protein [Xanthobacteraceae bacterium]
MNNHSHHDAGAPRARPADRTSDRAASKRLARRGDWGTLLVSIVATLAFTAVPGLPGYARDAKAADRTVQIGSARTTSVVVPIDKSEDVHTDQPFVDIVVGNPDIADVNALTDRSLSILGKKLGTTRVSIYGAEKRLIGVFDVLVSYDTSALSAELNRRFPTAQLKVSSVNGRILLSGTVSDGMVLDSALQVAKQFVPEVINSVQVAQPQQVMLEVRFVEATREADRELGVQWNVLPKPGSSERFIANIGSGQQGFNLPVTPVLPNQPLSSLATPTGIAAGSAGLIGTATGPFGFIAANLIAKGLQIDPVLNALEQRGLARRLAQPNLVALSGDTANFLAGGEYPIPVPGAYAGSIAVDYKQYGVSLAFTPTVLNGNLINLKIVPEVSQLDPANSVTVGQGIVVPALTVRRASSTIELKDGQSFVLAGLLQNNLSTAQQQLPWIGDVPVLGALFASKSYQKNETDLIIIVTPHLVNPTRPGDVVRTPLDNALPGNDVDFFLKNKPEVLRTEVEGGAAAVERGPIGHILEMPKGGFHAAAE